MIQDRLVIAVNEEWDVRHDRGLKISERRTGDVKLQSDLSYISRRVDGAVESVAHVISTSVVDEVLSSNKYTLALRIGVDPMGRFRFCLKLDLAKE